MKMSSQFHYYSSQRAQQDLAYRIRPLEESITAAWDWFRAMGYV
jgi:dihydroflavonol-4-reductase